MDTSFTSTETEYRSNDDDGTKSVKELVDEFEQRETGLEDCEKSPNTKLVRDRNHDGNFSFNFDKGRGGRNIPPPLIAPLPPSLKKAQRRQYSPQLDYSSSEDGESINLLSLDAENCTASSPRLTITHTSPKADGKTNVSRREFIVPSYFMYDAQNTASHQTEERLCIQRKNSDGSIALSQANIGDLLLGQSIDMTTISYTNERRADSKNSSGKNALHISCSKGRGDENFRECVNALLQHGFDPNQRDDEGNTALHIAIKCGESSYVEDLIFHGADLNARDNEGNTPLHLAANSGEKTILKMLLINMKNNDVHSFESQFYNGSNDFITKRNYPPCTNSSDVLVLNDQMINECNFGENPMVKKGVTDTNKKSYESPICRANDKYIYQGNCNNEEALTHQLLPQPQSEKIQQSPSEIIDGRTLTESRKCNSINGFDGNIICGEYGVHVRRECMAMKTVHDPKIQDVINNHNIQLEQVIQSIKPLLQTPPSRKEAPSYHSTPLATPTLEAYPQSANDFDVLKNLKCPDKATGKTLLCEKDAKFSYSPMQSSNNKHTRLMIAKPHKNQILNIKETMTVFKGQVKDDNHSYFEHAQKCNNEEKRKVNYNMDDSSAGICKTVTPGECNDKHLAVWNVFFENASKLSSDIKKEDQNEFYAEPSNDILNDYLYVKNNTSMNKKICILYARASYTNGSTLLHFACRKGDINTASLLIKHQANVDALDLKGNTPLHIVSSRGFEQIIRTLLSNNCLAHLTNKKGYTPLHLATLFGHKRCRGVLKKYANEFCSTAVRKRQASKAFSNGIFVDNDSVHSITMNEHEHAFNSGDTACMLLATEKQAEKIDDAMLTNESLSAASLTCFTRSHFKNCFNSLIPFFAMQILSFLRSAVNAFLFLFSHQDAEADLRYPPPPPPPLPKLPIPPALVDLDFSRDQSKRYPTSPSPPPDVTLAIYKRRHNQFSESVG